MGYEKLLSHLPIPFLPLGEKCSKFFHLLWKEAFTSEFNNDMDCITCYICLRYHLLCTVQGEETAFSLLTKHEDLSKLVHQLSMSSFSLWCFPYLIFLFSDVEGWVFGVVVKTRLTSISVSILQLHGMQTLEDSRLMAQVIGFLLGSCIDVPVPGFSAAWPRTENGSSLSLTGPLPGLLLFCLLKQNDRHFSLLYTSQIHKTLKAIDSSKLIFQCSCSLLFMVSIFSLSFWGALLPFHLTDWYCRAKSRIPGLAQ